MSILDSLFGKTFPAAKCKTLMTMIVSRIKLLRNKRELELKRMEKEVSQLLQAGQEPTARIRVEQIIKEENTLSAYSIIELFCEMLIVRLAIIEGQRECPLDLKEAITSLIFAAPRCSDLPELLHVRTLFGTKYGKEFVSTAAELKPDSGVNRQIIERLSVRTPAPDLILKKLKSIATEYNLGWDSSTTEAELFKLHEDLLDGSNHIFKGGEKHHLEEQNESPVRNSQRFNKAVTESETSDEGAEHPIPRTQAIHNNSPKGTVGQHNGAFRAQSIKNNSPSTDYNSNVTHVPTEEINGNYREHNKEAISSSSKDVLAVAQAALAAADHAIAAARVASDLTKVKI